MRSVKLTILGGFWDSQIYSSQLTLFDFEGGIHHIQWDMVIDSIASRYLGIQTAFRVAFSDGDLFYNPKVRKILRDPEISPIIKSQLSTLSGLNISESLAAWGMYTTSFDSPFGFLPTDTDIYYNQIFAGNDDGLFSTPNNLATKKPRKHFDASVMKINASDRNTSIAVAAGSDGLYEFAYTTEPTKILSNEKLLSDIPCNACDWAFQSVMGWSNEKVQNGV